MAKLKVFSIGNYNQGNWDDKRLRRMVKAYDPEYNIEAPAIIGHYNLPVNDEAQFAHGWVKKLSVENSGKDLFAEFYDFSEKLITAIMRKQLKYISIEVYAFDKLDPKDPPYLKAVAFLGRDTPAVPTTQIKELFKLKVDQTMETFNKEENVFTYTRKLNKEEIFSFVEAYQKQGKGADVANEKENQEEENVSKEFFSQLTGVTEEMKGLRAQMENYRKENQQLKDAAEQQESKNFFENFTNEKGESGVIPPAMVEAFSQLDSKLPPDMKEEFRKTISKFGKMATLSADHHADEPPEGTDEETTDPAQLVKKYQREKGIDSYELAADLLYQEKPELFK